MSDSEWEKLIATYRKDDAAMVYWEGQRELPEDPDAWLDKAEARLPGALGGVPDSIASEFGPLIAGQLRRCRRALRHGDERQARMLFAILEENFYRLNDNIATKREKDAQAQRVAAATGPREKARSELKARVKGLMRRRKQEGMSFSEFMASWLTSGPFEDLVLSRIDDVRYRIVDDDSGQERSLKESTLEREYWAKA